MTEITFGEVIHKVSSKILRPTPSNCSLKASIIHPSTEALLTGRTLSHPPWLWMRKWANRILLHNGGVVTGVGNLGQQLGIADANVHGPGLLGLNFTNGLASSLGASDSEQLFADTTL